MKTRQSHQQDNRKPILSSLALAVLSTLIAGGAHAAGTDIYTGSPYANAYGNKIVATPQNNANDVTASVEFQSGGVTVTGTQSGTSNSTTANITAANATGNSFANTIDLSLVGTTNNGYEGAATAGASRNTGVMSSTAQDNTLATDLHGFQNGSAVNAGNTISATTVANQGTSLIAGAVPNSATFGQNGYSEFYDYNNGNIYNYANGGIVVTSGQVSSANSSAIADNNDITLHLMSSANNTVTSGPVLKDNTISASNKGNSALSTADIQSGGVPSFTGSAVVSNVQGNDNAAGSATNSNSNISVYVASDAGVNTLAGALAVQNNSITSAATGNESLSPVATTAGNRILLGDAMSFAGTSGANGNVSLSNGTNNWSEINADLSVSNKQVNVASPVTSETLKGYIHADVNALDGGSIDLSGNSITARAMGNAASNAIASGSNAVSFAGSAALASQQKNQNGSVTALTEDAEIVADVSLTSDSTISVANNLSAATARGNQVSQNLALDATSLALGSTGVSLTGSVNSLSASGAATVSNMQDNVSASVSATNSNSWTDIWSSNTNTTNSTLSNTANTQEAVALGNSADNALGLKSTVIGGGAGIVSIQSGDSGSSVNATLSNSTNWIETAGASGSTLAVTDNLQRAIGYGNSASNTLTVASNAVTAAASGSGSPVIVASIVTADPAVARTFDSATAPAVAGAYGILNSQLTQAGVSAMASIDGSASAEIAVSGSLAGSIARNEGNVLVAAAYGNDGKSGIALNTGNIASTGFAAVANVTNTQTVAAGILATTVSGAGARTGIDGTVTDSTVTASGNIIEALANGSIGNNSLNVVANNITTSGSRTIGSTAVSDIATGVTTLSTDASFSIQNAQSGQGSVRATQLDGSNLPTDVRVSISSNVADSTVAANGNTSVAAATSNGAVNALSLAGGQVSSSSALQNFQVTNAAISSLIGQAGTVGSPGTGIVEYLSTGASSQAGNNTTLSAGGSLTVGSSETVSFDLSFISGTNLTALQQQFTDLGFTVTGTTAVAGQGNYNLSSFIGRQLVGTTLTFTGFIVPGTPATAGAPNQGGVTLTVGGTVANSTLSVDGNTTSGSATGNRASNSNAVTASGIDSGNGTGQASAVNNYNYDYINDVLIDRTINTVADHVLSNIQSVTGSNPISSSVHGTFAIDAQPAVSIVNSALSVSNNSQSATAVGNTAGNALTLSAATLATSAALQSVQSGTVAVSALSNLEMYAPGSVDASSVALSGNRNSALAVINDVTNTLSAAGTNIGNGSLSGSSYASNDSNLDFVSTNSSAQLVLLNRQQASSSVTSTAVTTLYNQDGTVSATPGLANGSLTVAGNSTAAEASANRAINTASVSGTATQGGSVALNNSQFSNASVVADARTTSSLVLNGAASALTQGSVLQEGNSTTALARGNVASNALNSAAGSAYSGSQNSGYANLDAYGVSNSNNYGNVQGNAAILNNQANFGAVTASSTDATYQLALNSSGSPSVTQSSVGVMGNTVSAAAYGNSANNSMTLNALNTGNATAAIGNVQSNNAAVMATVTGANYGINVSGGVTNSSLRTNGNQVLATAVGNSSVSAILAR